MQHLYNEMQLVAVHRLTSGHCALMPDGGLENESAMKWFSFRLKSRYQSVLLHTTARTHSHAHTILNG